jgi:hypothetical protein
MSDSRYEEIPVQGEAIKIYFCAGCNQSIPLFDIQSGKAVERGGEYFCTNCRPVRRPAPAAARRGPRITTWVCALFLLAAAVVLAVQLISRAEWFQAPRKAGPRGPDNRDVLASLGRVEQHMQELIATHTGRMQDSLDARYRDLAARLEKNETALRSLVGQIETLEANAKRALTRASLDEMHGQFKVQVGEILREIQSIRGDLTRLEAPARTPVAARSSADPAAEPETAPAAAEPENEKAAGLSETDLWILRLKDKDLDERRRAVSALSHYRGAKVEEALIQALADWSPSIRSLAAADLGERKATTAIKPLLKVLEDTNPSVRETGVQALRKITGRSFGYKPDASDRKRTQAIERWRGFVAALTRKTG